MSSDKDLDSLLKKLGKPSAAEAAHRKRRDKQAEWGIVIAFGVGLILAIAKVKASALILLGAGIAFVLYSRDREGAFISLLFLMAVVGAVLGLIGGIFGIPGLGSASGPGGMTGGWQY